MPTKTWVVGEEVLAADFNSFVQQQVVATFANAAARDAAVPAPTSGMVVWLVDATRLQVYSGTAWKNVPGGPVSAGNGYAQITAPSGAVANTPLVVPGLTITGVNVAAGHRLRLSLGVTVGQQTVASLVRPSIYMDGARVAGGFVSLAAGGYMTTMVGAVVSPSTGPHNFDVYLATDGGTAIVHADATGPSWLYVEDLG